MEKSRIEKQFDFIKEIDKEKQMKKILFLLLALILSAFSAAAQPTANGTDLKLPDISYAALNLSLIHI